MKNNVLSIDTGNTRTHMAVVDTGELSCVDRVDFDNAAFDERFMPSIKNLLSTRPQIRKINVTSCVKDLLIKAKDFCTEFDGVDVNVVAVHKDLPVSINYETPQTLGTDRISNALACAAMFAGRTCVIICAGTAITVDYLHDGKIFEGGAILPGPVMQTVALHRQTDALPSVNLCPSNCEDDDGAVTIPSKSTEKCIKAGILLGTAGAIERCISEYMRISNSQNNDTMVIATGGDWDIISPLVNPAIKINTIPDLTLIGAALF